MNKTYTIAEMSDYLNTHKTKIRRVIDELGIKAINETNRKHVNSPKFYSNDSKTMIFESLHSETEVEHSETEVEHSETEVEHSKTEVEHNETEVEHNETEVEHNETEVEQGNQFQNDMIDLLKEQLRRADKDKEELVRALREAQQLVNQQQQLSLQANQKIEILELELIERIDESKKKESRFSFFSKKRKQK